jgi:hypothetical protein
MAFQLSETGIMLHISTNRIKRRKVAFFVALLVASSPARSEASHYMAIQMSLLMLAPWLVVAPPGDEEDAARRNKERPNKKRLRDEGDAANETATDTGARPGPDLSAYPAAMRVPHPALLSLSIDSAIGQSWSLSSSASDSTTSAMSSSAVSSSVSSSTSSSSSSSAEAPDHLLMLGAAAEWSHRVASAAPVRTSLPAAPTGSAPSAVRTFTYTARTRERDGTHWGKYVDGPRATHPALPKEAALAQLILSVLPATGHYSEDEILEQMRLAGHAVERSTLKTALRHMSNSCNRDFMLFSGLCKRDRKMRFSKAFQKELIQRKK